VALASNYARASVPADGGPALILPIRRLLKD